MRDNPTFHRSSQGFTLVELMVAISISGIIFLAVSALIGTLFSSSARVTQLDALSQIKDDIAKDMSNSVRWAPDVSVSPGNDELTLTSAQGEDTLYHVVDSQLFKNDTPLSPIDYEVTDFSVHDYGAGRLASLDIELSLRSKKFTARTDTIKLVISQRQTDVTIHN